MVRETSNLISFLVPWESRIKEIESLFGSAVASYFTFLRWVFWINLVLTSCYTAFVVVPEVVARSALGPDGVELFSLHEAAELAVVERSGDSVLVRLPDARKGWLPASAVLSTAPSAPFPLGEAPGPQPASSGL